MKGTVRNGLFIQLDALTMKRVERQAKRTYGVIQGATQSYVRAALLKQLQTDEKTDEENKPKEAAPA